MNGPIVPERLLRPGSEPGVAAGGQRAQVSVAPVDRRSPRRGTNARGVHRVRRVEELVSTGRNPYFILEPGYDLVLQREVFDAKEDYLLLGLI